MCDARSRRSGAPWRFARPLLAVGADGAGAAGVRRRRARRKAAPSGCASRARCPTRARRAATRPSSPTAARRATKRSRSRPRRKPPIDCFYVYPTVSEQEGPNADLTIEPQETQIAIDQASRFSQVCQVYAPMYPQLTLKAINTPGGVTPEDRAEGLRGRARGLPRIPHQVQQGPPDRADRPLAGLR